MDAGAASQKQEGSSAVGRQNCIFHECGGDISIKNGRLVSLYNPEEACNNMSEHPIQGLMRTAMENIKRMVDVNTIVGEPVTTPDGTLIMPISKVGFGFAAGGSEFTTEHDHGGENGKRNSATFESKQSSSVAFPFGGGSGGGVSITPIAFLVVGQHGVKIVPLDHSSRVVERILDQVPALAEKFAGMFGGEKSADPDMSELDDVTTARPMEPISKDTFS